MPFTRALVVLGVWGMIKVFQGSRFQCAGLKVGYG